MVSVCFKKKIVEINTHCNDFTVMFDLGCRSGCHFYTSNIQWSRHAFDDRNLKHKTGRPTMFFTCEYSKRTQRIITQDKYIITCTSHGFYRVNSRIKT